MSLGSKTLDFDTLNKPKINMGIVKEKKDYSFNFDLL